MNTTNLIEESDMSNKYQQNQGNQGSQGNKPGQGQGQGHGQKPGQGGFNKDRDNSSNR